MAMVDPYVECLKYAVIVELDGTEYNNPPAVDHETSRATYRLEAGNLTAWPKGNYATERDALEAIQPDLDAWESSADLERAVGELRFRFTGSTIKDRAPAPSAPGQLQAHAVLSSGIHTVSATLRVQRKRATYPSPPVAFDMTSETVQALMARYRRWKAGAQDLEHFAYYVAVLLRYDSQWQISDNVLGKLQTLSSYKGGPHSSRKPNPQPLSDLERRWMEVAIVAIIKQVAAVEAYAQPKQLTMGDLP